MGVKQRHHEGTDGGSNWYAMEGIETVEKILVAHVKVFNSGEDLLLSILEM